VVEEIMVEEVIIHQTMMERMEKEELRPLQAYLYYAHSTLHVQ
jgi:hypothetical protein